jgi:hypothetical protein
LQPVAERRPLPVEAGAQRVERHALDPGQHPGEVVLLVGPRGRQREAAVSTEDCGDAVLYGRARGRIPEQLSVVVGVQVDEARCERLSGRINGFRGLLVDITDGNDPPVAHADVAMSGGCACAVDDLGISDEYIQHCSLLCACQPLTVG